MALYHRQMSTRQQLFTGVVLLAVIGATLTSCAAAYEESLCPSESLVYPYWSMCFSPAVYGDQVHIVSFTGGLVSEYDETNQTYYMRLTGEFGDVGSLYTLTPLEAELLGTAIPWGGTVVLGGLTWRNESEELWFLVDCSSSSTCDPALFTIESAGGSISGACPFIYGARCEGYYLKSSPGSYSSGLASSVEDGVTYIKLGDEGTNGDIKIEFRRGGSVTGKGHHEALRMVV